MKKSCKYCGRYHDVTVVCASKPPRKKLGNTAAERFRSTSAWKKKSIEIRTRDKGLCQWCLRIVPVRYSFDVEVHHIIKLEADITKALDNSNLITLCKEHHIQADAYEIPIKELQTIVKGMAV
ncbi:HNH endonuclease [Paenibacillus sp. Soil724D2]|uniref:HNH endonuclease n=1 Tax=Paenibacillus sp. (strain Soil724D2) TaxID=1736392 RepID=UPI000712DD3F|nr:HNH endonuclease [Paenibacillus sp. Soil724D2]KRE33413.1 hypothetical protein ASG85_14180 [Paenibacillus sp. Soil724D2]